MPRISSIFNFKKWPLAFIGCLLLLLIAESLTRFYLPYLYTHSDIVIAYKKDLIETSWEGKDSINGIIMGDSRILGLHAKEISEAVSKASAEKGKSRRSYHFFNYSFPNHGVRSYYLLLKKYLYFNPKPEIIIFSSSPYALTRHWNLKTKDQLNSKDFHRFVSLFSIQECAEVFSSRNLTKAMAIKLEHQSMLVAYRKRIQLWFQNPSDFKDKRAWLKRSITKSNGGALIGRNIPSTSKDVMNSEYYVNYFDPEKDSILWYQNFFALAQKNNVKIIVLNAPLPAALYHKREASGENKKYIKLMEKFKSEFNNIILLNPLIEGYELNYFSDTHHLNKNGFKKFSKESRERLTEAILSKME